MLQKKLTNHKWFLALLIPIILIHFWSLIRIPALFVDEAWYASRAWGFIHTNRIISSLDIGIFDYYDGYWTYLPWTGTFLQSFAFRFVPAPQLFPIRLVSLSFGLILLASIYAIGNRLGGQRQGLLSVFLVSISIPFSYSAHQARTDILAAAFGYVAVALYFNNSSHKLWVSLLSGLCVGLAFEIHPHSVIFGPAIAALYFLRLRWSILRSQDFWSFVVGVSLGLAFYVAIHILPYPETYFAINRMVYSATHTPPLLTLDPQVMQQAVREMVLFIYLAYSYITPLVILSFVTLARKRSTTDQELLTLALTLIAGHTWLIGNKLIFYVILTFPAIDLMVAAFLLDFFSERPKNKYLDLISRVAVLSFLSAYLIALIWRFSQNYWPNYTMVQNRINQSVQPNDSIMGPQTYWFELYNHTYMPWEALPYYLRYFPGSTLEDAFRKYHPDIFIIDDFSNGFISDHPDESVHLLVHLQVPRTELENFLQDHARLIDEFKNDLYGEIRVYRINWTEEKE